MENSSMVSLTINDKKFEIGLSVQQKDKLKQETLKGIWNEGAVGDGETDDTAAFQDALANNRVVRVPGGTYVLSDTLVIRENCCLELSQDTVLQFTQTSGNCIVLQGSATLRGNQAIISVPYAFTGKTVVMDTNLETDTIIPPYKKVGSHMFKRQRFVYDVNIIKPTAAGFCRSNDGKCNGTAVYMCADSTESHMWMWAVALSGIRIAGGFNYGIRAVNIDSPAGSDGHYEDDAWNHDMRIEAVIEGCEIGVALENCNGAHLSVTIQPGTAMDGTKYAKHGVYLNDAKYIDMTRSRVWDWNETATLWTSDGQYQHIAMIGQCRGLLLDDYLYHESGTDIRKLIYTDTPSNLEKMTILQEPFTRWFKPVDGDPYFYDGNGNQRLAKKSEIDEYFQTDRIAGFTDALAAAIDTDGSIYNGIGYNKYGGALNSSGNKVAGTEAYYGHTGFIPCKSGDTIYVKNIAIAEIEGYTKAFAYDANFNLLGQNNTGSIIDGSAQGVFSGTAAEDGGILIPVNAKTAYLRLGFKSVYMGDDPIISVNKEIKFLQAGFLADGIKVKAENVVGLTGGGGGVSSWNDLVEVLPEMECAYEESMSCFVGVTDFMLVPGRKYIVNWNGVEYTATAEYGEFALGETSALVLFAGNPMLIGGEDNGLPFGLANMIGKGGFIGAIPLDGSTSLTISIKSYTLYEASGPLLLGSDYDNAKNEATAVYATPEQIEQAFFAGKRIVAIAFNGGFWQMQLVEYVPRAMTTDGSSVIAFHVPTAIGVSYYLMQYNNDGTYVPYSD